jgi:hypothetical protein
MRRLEAREETIGDRGGSIRRVKVLERRVERKERAISILANVIKLSNLPSGAFWAQRKPQAIFSHNQEIDQLGLKLIPFDLTQSKHPLLK